MNPKEKHKPVIELLKAGKTIREVAAATNYTYKSVGRLAAQYGIKVVKSKTRERIKRCEPVNINYAKGRMEFIMNAF